MESNNQILDVIYSNEEITCDICLEKKESNGNMAKLSKCNHCFHIKCLITPTEKKNETKLIYFYIF
jgi:hypothetical protein